MSTDGVLGAVWLPTDGWLDPSGPGAWPSPPAPASAASTIATNTRVVAIGVERGRVTGVDVERDGDARDDRGRRRRQRRRDVRARDRPAGRRHRPDHPDGPPVPVHRADRRGPSGPAAAARPGQPRLLPRGGRRAVHGRLRAQPGAVVASTAIPPTSTASCWRPTGRASSEIMAGADPARARRSPTPACTRMINGPEAFTPGQRVHPRRERGPRLLRRRRLLRPRHRRSRRDRPPGRELDRRRRAGARPVEDGHPPLRRPVPRRASYTPGPDDRGLRAPTTTSTTRTRSARPAGRCGLSPAYERLARARRRRSARSPAGSARTGSSPTRTTRASAGGA